MKLYSALLIVVSMWGIPLKAADYGVVNVIISVPRKLTMSQFKAFYTVCSGKKTIIETTELSWWINRDSGRFELPLTKKKLVLKLSFLDGISPHNIQIPLDTQERTRQKFGLYDKKNRRRMLLFVKHHMKHKIIEVFITVKVV